VSEIVQVQVPPNIDRGPTEGAAEDMLTSVYVVIDRFSLGPRHVQLGMPTLHRPIERQPILLQAAVSLPHLSTVASRVAYLICCTAPSDASERAA
jgi:hypothetical protein